MKSIRVVLISFLTSFIITFSFLLFLERGIFIETPLFDFVAGTRITNGSYRFDVTINYYDLHNSPKYMKIRY